MPQKLKLTGDPDAPVLVQIQVPTWMKRRAVDLAAAQGKTLSDWFQPYGPDTSATPQPLTHLWESVTGTEAPWASLSTGYHKTHWDRTFDGGMQYAFADLQSQGVMPPLPAAARARRGSPCRRRRRGSA